MSTVQNNSGPRSFLDALRTDLLPSLVVFLIAIPLSLGIAQASGAPIIAGLIAGAVGGIIARFLGETPLRVSGPAAAWLAHSLPSVERFRRGETLDSRLPPADQLSQINVVQQLQNLQTYPRVRQRLQSGTLRLVGLWFHIETATVCTYSETKNRFVPVAESDEALKDAYHQAERTAVPA